MLDIFSDMKKPMKLKIANPRTNAKQQDQQTNNCQHNITNTDTYTHTSTHQPNRLSPSHSYNLQFMYQAMQ